MRTVKVRHGVVGGIGVTLIGGVDYEDAVFISFPSTDSGVYVSGPVFQIIPERRGSGRFRAKA